MFSFNKHVFFSALAVLLLAVLVCFRFFGEVILHPDEFLFGPGGDGLKNYFTVAYQVIHGEGNWFNGMLYPYGDHLIYADGQPLLVKVLKWIIDPDVANGPQVIGVLNLLKFVSLVITAWCIHRLLIWNYVNPWFAVPFALTIAFLSPQVARFVGHHALAYTSFVPVIWLLIEAMKRYRFKWLLALLTSAVVLLSGFLHPYYLFLFVIFLGSIIGWDLMIKKFRVEIIKGWAPQIFSLAVPLLLFMAYQKGADLYSDRPASPTGMLSYMATFQTVFVPVAEPFRSLFNSYFFRIFIPGSWEGEAYIGMVASFTAFASLYPMTKRFLKRRLKVLTHPVLPNSLRSVFIPGIITLLFALGLFHKLGLSWLSEFVTPLKQFRSLGRVAWIFYYVFSVWTAYHLYVLFRYLRSVKKGGFQFHALLIVGLCAFLWTLDAIVNIKFTKSKILNKVAYESFSDNYAKQWAESGLNLDEYQAIMPLPLHLVGSEKIGLEMGHLCLLHAMKGSFSTGLPIIGGAMSRTSLDVTEKTAQIVANPLFPRPIFDDLDPYKKLLLLRTNEPLTVEEERLSSIADLVHTSAEYQLLSISPAEIVAHYKSLMIVPDSLDINHDNPYQKPLEFAESKDELWGEVAYRMHALDDILDTVFITSDTKVLSYWVKVNPKDVLIPNRVYSVDNEWKMGGGIGKNPNLWDNWLFVSDTLQTKAGTRHKYVVHARPGTISRILLRNLGEDIIHSEGDQLYFNNIPLNRR